LNRIDKLKFGYSMKVLDGSDILEQVKNGKITAQQYEEITNQECPEIELEVLKQNQMRRLKIECANAIYRGFPSDVSRETLWYDFDDKAQANFNQQATMYILDSTLDIIPWNTKAQGEYTSKVVMLTKEQFFQLVGKSAEHKLSNFQKYWILMQKLEVAETAEELEEITWGDEGDIDENITI
jgi:hypothetical protein